MEFYYNLPGLLQGNGLFAASAGGLTTSSVLGYIGLSLVTFLLWIAISFLLGLYFGPFVTFVLSAVFLYGGNYISTQDMTVSRLFPSYWGNQVLLGSQSSDYLLPALGSVLLTVVLTVIILIFTTWRFNKTDIR